jgi:hypothetical protein
MVFVEGQTGMGARPQDRRLDWEAYIDEGDLQPFLSDLPPPEAGSLFHRYMEENVSVPGADWEGAVYEDDEVVGRYDCYDELEGVVYEFKTKDETGMRAAPYSRDIMQIKGYLDALDEDIGFLIYVDRESLDVEDYPVLR